MSTLNVSSSFLRVKEYAKIFRISIPINKGLKVFFLLLHLFCNCMSPLRWKYLREKLKSFVLYYSLKASQSCQTFSHIFTFQFLWTDKYSLILSAWGFLYADCILPNNLKWFLASANTWYKVVGAVIIPCLWFIHSIVQRYINRFCFWWWMYLQH